LFVPITEETSNVRSNKATPLFGRNTPTISNWQQTEVRPVANGQEKGVVVYSVEEHVAVLQLMLSQPKAFNASKSSEEWRDLHKEDVQGLLSSKRQQSLVVNHATWAPG
jgi:hypothetical protein